MIRDAERRDWRSHAERRNESDERRDGRQRGQPAKAAVQATRVPIAGPLQSPLTPV